MTLFPTITTIFTDLGEVLLTNGWDSEMRKNAALQFGYDFEEVESRHKLSFGVFEQGRISLKEYLKLAVFFKKRNFTEIQYEQYMYQQSQPHPQMLELLKTLKKQGLKIVAVSNEGKELTAYRVETFKLREFIDVFVISCFIDCLKPDPNFFKYALNLSQSLPSETVYLDDRLPFVEVAKSLDIIGIHHTSYFTTRTLLKKLIKFDGD